MASESQPLLSQCPARGTYAPSKPTDIRGPCPMLNCLANHGYIPRDGRNVDYKTLKNALSEGGIAASLASVFSKTIYIKYEDPKTAYLRKPRTFWQNLWYYLRNPLALLFAKLGIWAGGKVDGKRVLNLDRLALPSIIEHDISLTRRDFLQKEGNNALQPELVEELLTYSTDGKTLTIDDFARFRKWRMEEQLKDNPGCLYGSLQHQIACSEIALIINAIGDGQSVRVDWLRAFLLEERLPTQEGWRKRWWWPMGIVEFVKKSAKVKDIIGLNI